jgi:hypothetical protein
MTTYFCKVIGADDDVLAAKRFEATNDTFAIREARMIFARAIGHGYEAWDGERLIYRELLRPLTMHN